MPRMQSNYRVFTVLRDSHRNKDDNTKSEELVKSRLFTRRRYIHTNGNDEEDVETGQLGFIDKIKGASGDNSPSVSYSDIAFAGFGTFIGIGTWQFSYPLWLGSRRRNADIGVIWSNLDPYFGAPAAPFSQPRNVLGGHCCSVLWCYRSSVGTLTI